MAEPVRVPVAGGYVVLIDAEDAARVATHRWHMKRSYRSKRLYAQRTVVVGGTKTSLALHRFVMNAEPGEVIDHANGDTLDNRKANLRRCTNRQNAQNVVESANQRRGRFKGVYQPKKTWRWCAAISAGELKPNGRRKRIHLGSYDTPEEAAEAYDLAAVEHYGEFAALNFPQNRIDYECLLIQRRKDAERAHRLGVIPGQKWGVTACSGGDRLGVLPATGGAT